MKLHDLLERRRNPDLNPRFSAVEFLRQYKDNPKMYLHTTSIPKVGIYPNSTASHDSPAGIYAYRLMDIWDDTIERWNTGEHKRGLEFLPYHGGDYLFVLESDIDPDFPHDYSEQDLAAAIVKLKKLYGFSDERIAKLMAAARTNLNFRDCPAGYLWGMTKALMAGGISEFDEYTPVDTIRWNGLLRKLGYVGFNDPGMGLIHGAEASQALFLVTSAFRVVDQMLQNRKQRVIAIGDQKYKGGRLPKNLVMNGIPNTLFHNYHPADFASVRTWTVGGMGLDNLSTFIRFVPWNAQGIIKRLVIGSAANESYERSYVSRFFASHPTLPKNIRIEDIYVGGKQPSSLIRAIPPDYPVETITISALAHKWGLDDLPAPIKAKLKEQPFR